MTDPAATPRREPDLSAALRDDDDDALEFTHPGPADGLTHAQAFAPAIPRPEPPRVASGELTGTSLPDIVIPRELTRRPSSPASGIILPDPPTLAPASGILTRRDGPAAPHSSLEVTLDTLDRPQGGSLELTRESSDHSRPPLAETRVGRSLRETASPEHRKFAVTAEDHPDDLGQTLAAPATPHDPLPRQIGRFAVLRRLGRGGMGTVYAAFDEQLTRRVAIKVLHTDTGERAPLTAEARAMAQLSHPNVVQVYELGEHEHHPFLAMEYVEGRTLGDWLDTDHPPWQQILARFIAAGEGLAAAHKAGLVHRDFKPDNVLLGADNVPRVADFGLARASAEGVAQIAGTPGYMSPEQYEGSLTDARSDQFSFY